VRPHGGTGDTIRAAANPTADHGKDDHPDPGHRTRLNAAACSTASAVSLTDPKELADQVSNHATS
jgi:hypothetical protein